MGEEQADSPRRDAQSPRSRICPGTVGADHPWPAGLASTSHAGDARVSRAEVTGMVADALRREAFREALVATYVWGKGKSGTPGGSGPWTLQKILAAGILLDAALAASVTALREKGAVDAYTVLHKAVPQFGPSFSTKFLYFAGQALPTVPGLQPLILDRVLSLRLRPLAAAVGRESGLDPDGTVAAWVWAEWDWTPHRYSVYLSFMHSAARQIAGTKAWPSGAAPDLLEYALFSGVWTMTD
ncbi:8-oxoguanine DNA glycosylase OGG fold protein [Streptomyces glaucescens]